MFSLENTDLKQSLRVMRIDLHVSGILQAVLIGILMFIAAQVYKALLRQTARDKSHYEAQDSGFVPSPGEEISMAAKKTDKWDPASNCVTYYQEMYFKLHNLEQHPEILVECRDLLVGMFAETLARARDNYETNILSIGEYTANSLMDFLNEENRLMGLEWEKYVARRNAGAPAELFRSKSEAVWWLRQITPVKYVDGAWLGHINKITTPYALRRATKDAWQVMSEELGDGNPQMNHVYVYRDLMSDIDDSIPEAHELDFIHPRYGMDTECVWKAAVSQLLISLFPHEFLPEILGFNLHFEGLTMETMKAAKEVEEFGFNAYYFILHISIDNADSGHIAIAAQAVVKYMDHILQTEGEDSAKVAWKRVQIGYLMSQGLPTVPTPSTEESSRVDSFPRTRQEADAIHVFRAKAPVAHKIHCSSRIKFGGRKLDDWLDPMSFASKQWQMDFLHSLGNLKPWVRKGNSSNSKLVQELTWGGRMFGSFTQSEVEIVKRWIDSMGEPDRKTYWTFSGRLERKSVDVLRHQDIRSDYPVLHSEPISPPTPHQDTAFSARKDTQVPVQGDRPNIAVLLPLWFTSPCLLENFVSVPSKTTSKLASSIVRFLRAQNGFDVEGPVVAGMDEARREDSAGLIELGLEMMTSLDLPQPTCLKEILGRWHSDFALNMLQVSMHPMANAGYLLGMAWAFVGLHETMSSSPLLSHSSQQVLQQVVGRERCSLEECFLYVQDDKAKVLDIQRGYNTAQAEISRCFKSDEIMTKSLPSTTTK